MPSDDYSSYSGGGALKLKGAKVQKARKKKKDKKTSIPAEFEPSLSVAARDDHRSSSTKEPEKTRSSRKANDVDKYGRPEDEEDEGEAVDEYKTEAERRHEEATRKKMLKMLEDPNVSSELLKTHKERVEGLNTYLSKLSEHHDMPKIGPG
ncbi:hypothetical protein F4778DRAFT_788645 [Xylariomycetidae sp. FL2044]|nr:hypothetical protein F4778DRAFT_788645 [Xylariomycetidae sp. FL2044]